MTVVHDPGAWKLLNPKRDRTRVGRASWYPYYAGFSLPFAAELLRTAARTSMSIVDPWNGSGTTSHAASQGGHSTFGFDLNPVMVVVAKARLVDRLESLSLLPLGDEVIRYLEPTVDPQEPLNKWFDPKLASIIRAIQRAVLRLFVPDAAGVDDFSDLASFFHVALFRLVRDLLQPFQTSNPTWFRRPSPGDVIRGLTHSQITTLFSKRVAEMAAVDTLPMLRPRDCTILQASSERLPLDSDSIDLVLGSPPYCTRIDYAIATLPELAVLGFDERAVQILRRTLIGTSTVQTEPTQPRIEWGAVCANFISKLARHPSKASRGYYYKNHCDYYDRLCRSIGEIARVLKSGGYAALVLQESYYKNLRNDLASIVTEMAEAHGLRFKRAVDFASRGSMVFVNSRATASRRRVIETVLCLAKES